MSLLSPKTWPQSTSLSHGEGHTAGATGCNTELQIVTTPGLSERILFSSPLLFLLPGPPSSDGNLGCAVPASPLAVVVRKRAL